MRVVSDGRWYDGVHGICIVKLLRSDYIPIGLYQNTVKHWPTNIFNKQVKQENIYLRTAITSRCFSRCSKQSLPGLCVWACIFALVNVKLYICAKIVGRYVDPALENVIPMAGTKQMLFEAARGKSSTNVPRVLKAIFMHITYGETHTFGNSVYVLMYSEYCNLSIYTNTSKYALCAISF